MRILELLKIVSGSLAGGGLKNMAMAFINLNLEPGKMSSYPVMVQVEPTVHCNLECVMCANPISGRKKKHMSLAEFKKVVDAIPGLKKISLVGAGEPLMNPELSDMIVYAKSKGILTGFATNAMLLTEDNSKRMIEIGVDWINISVDSANKDRYAAIRKGADLDVVKKNISHFMNIKGIFTSPDVSIWFVIMEDNMGDLPGVIKFSKLVGVKKVCAQLEHNWSNDSLKSSMKNRYSVSFYEKVKELLKAAMDIANAEGVFFDYVNVPDPKSVRSCKWPWKSCYITAEGFVTPCCLQGSDPSRINFGNIFDVDFSEIWNNASYQAFRKTLRSARAPQICIDCTAYPSRMKL